MALLRHFGGVLSLRSHVLVGITVGTIVRDSSCCKNGINMYIMLSLYVSVFIFLFETKHKQEDDLRAQVCLDKAQSRLYQSLLWVATMH